MTHCYKNTQECHGAITRASTSREEPETFHEGCLVPQFGQEKEAVAKQSQTDPNMMILLEVQIVHKQSIHGSKEIPEGRSGYGQRSW